PQAVEVFGPGAPRRQSRGLGLEGAAYGEQLVELGLVPIADPIAVTAFMDHQSFESQPPERADHRSIAGPLGQRERLLTEGRTGSEASVEDLRTKGLVNAGRFAATASRGGFGRALAPGEQGGGHSQRLELG